MHRAVILTVAGITMLTAAGCSSRSQMGGTKTPSSQPAAPSATPVTSSVSPAERDSQQAIEMYLGMWRAMKEAAATSDWRSPELAKYATGDALNVITRSLYNDNHNGVVTKGEQKNAPSASSVEQNTVLITDCGDDSGWLKYNTNGQLLNDTPGGRRSITAEVKRQTDGSWRVTRFAVQGVGSC